MTANKKGIVIPTSIIELIDEKVKISAVKVEGTKKSGMSPKEVAELKANLSLLRSSALFILNISVCIGRGTSNISLEVNDIVKDEQRTSAFQKNGIKMTMGMSKLIADARVKLNGKRARIISRYYKNFGELLVVPSENLAAVQEEIEELISLVEEQKQAILDGHEDGYRNYLYSLAEVAIANDYDEKGCEKFIKTYSSRFPTKQDIADQLSVVISPLIKLPSLQELAQEDATIAEAETRRQQVLEEAEAERAIRKMAETQMKASLGQIIESAREHFLQLVSAKLEAMTRLSPVDDAQEREVFRKNLEEMQLFVQGQDASLQELFGEVANLQSLMKGTSSNADIRKDMLLKQITAIHEKYSESFASVKSKDPGHRFAAMRGIRL